VAKKSAPKKKSSGAKKAPPFAKAAPPSRSKAKKPKLPVLGGGLMGLGGTGAQGMMP
jgi:hypothetical protein